MKTTRMGILFACFAVTITGCGAGADTTSESGSAESAAQTAEGLSASVGLDGCTLNAYTPGRSPYFDAPRAAGGSINCPSWRSDLQIRVCMQQLVTGGWQTLGWTCEYSGHTSGLGVESISKSVPYYTAGRWYRSWVWGDVNGANTAIVSGGCKGNGGSGCN